MYPTLTAALEYAALGYRVLPLKPGSKVPDLRHWPEEASSEAAIVKRQFAASLLRAVQAAPEGRTHEAIKRRSTPNVGIATGHGLAVLDIDLGHGGARPDWAVPTQEVSTASGGLHLYYSVTASVPNSVGRVAPGVDVRGERGQVVAPPSEIRDREQGPGGFTEYVAAYSWANDLPVAELDPDLLIPDDLKHGFAGVGHGRSFEWRDDVPVGERNNYLTSLAGHLMATGNDRADTFMELTAEAQRLGFTPRDGELGSIVRSVARYHQ